MNSKIDEDIKTQCFVTGDLSGLFDLVNKGIVKKKLKRKMIGVIQKIFFYKGE